MIENYFWLQWFWIDGKQKTKRFIKKINLLILKRFIHFLVFQTIIHLRYNNRFESLSHFSFDSILCWFVQQFLSTLCNTILLEYEVNNYLPNGILKDFLAQIFKLFIASIEKIVVFSPQRFQFHDIITFQIRHYFNFFQKWFIVFNVEFNYFYGTNFILIFMLSFSHNTIIHIIYENEFIEISRKFTVWLEF